MNNNHQSEQDYLEKILMLSKQLSCVRSIDIAQFMGFSKASVSVAMKKLEEKNLIIFNRTTGAITLTEQGKNIANEVLIRHETLCDFFKSIGVSEKVAEEDACKIEHDLSDETFSCLKKHLSKKNK